VVVDLVMGERGGNIIKEGSADDFAKETLRSYLNISNLPLMVNCVRVNVINMT
jgi:hypothetical protein